MGRAPPPPRCVPHKAAEGSFQPTATLHSTSAPHSPSNLTTGLLESSGTAAPCSSPTPTHFSSSPPVPAAPPAQPPVPTTVALLAVRCALASLGMLSPPRSITAHSVTSASRRALYERASRLLPLPVSLPCVVYSSDHHLTQPLCPAIVEAVAYPCSSSRM